MKRRSVIVCHNLIDLFDALPLHPELRARLGACFFALRACREHMEVGVGAFPLGSACVVQGRY